jgi:hypothetical protein
MSTFLNKIDSLEFPAFLLRFKEVVCLDKWNKGFMLGAKEQTTKQLSALLCFKCAVAVLSGLTSGEYEAQQGEMCV